MRKTERKNHTSFHVSLCILLPLMMYGNLCVSAVCALWTFDCCAQERVPSHRCHGSIFYFIGCIYLCVCMCCYINLQHVQHKSPKKMLLKYFNMVLFITIYHYYHLNMAYFNAFPFDYFDTIWYTRNWNWYLNSEIDRTHTFICECKGNACLPACRTCKHIYVYKSSNKSRTPHKYI